MKKMTLCAPTPGLMKRPLSAKRPFTLIEVLICLSLIALIGGIISVRARAMINRHAFNQSANRLLYQLNLAKQLASLSGNDLTLNFRYKGKKLYVNRSSGTTKMVKGKKEDPFKAVLRFDALSNLYFDGKEKKEWTYHFFPNEGPKEGKVLHLSYKGKYNCWIDLTATPFFVRLNNLPLRQVQKNREKAYNERS